MEPRNRLPGTEGLASQWDLPYDVSRDDSHGSRTSGEVQSARRAVGNTRVPSAWRSVRRRGVCGDHVRRMRRPMLKAISRT